MATSKFIRTFRSIAGVPITTAAIWLVPQANTYPTGALALTPHATRDGQYYRDNVPDGEYKIYIDPAGGSSPTLYEEEIWIGDARITTISDHFDAADSYKLKETGIKDEAVTATKIANSTIVKSKFSSALMGTFDRKGFQVRTLTRPTWDEITRTLTWASPIHIVSAVHTAHFELAPGSKVLASSDAVYLSLTNGSYTPLNMDANAFPTTVYLFAQNQYYTNKADDGMFLIGQVLNEPTASNWFYFITEWDALRPDRWLDREFKNLVITRQGGLYWNTDTKVLTLTNVAQFRGYLREGKVFHLNLGSDVDEISINVPLGYALVLTGDSTGATFTPINPTSTRTVGWIAISLTSLDLRDKETIILGACYWAFHLTPGGQGQFYGRFPAFMPDDYSQFGGEAPPAPEAIESFNLVGINANAIGNFIHKLKAKTVDANNLLTLVTWGDSIFGRLYRAEMSESANPSYCPPAMYRQNIAKDILDNIQFSDSDLAYLPIKDMSGFITQDVGSIDPPSPAPPDNSEWTFSGTWVEYMNYDCTYYKKSVTYNSYAQVAVTGCEFMALIAIRRSNADNALNVTVSVNGGGYVNPSTLGIGVNTINLQKAEVDYSHNEQRFYRTIFSGLVSGNTYTFRFTKGTNDSSQVILWGVETWTENSVRLINTARGGHTSVGLLNYLYDDVITTNYFPDAVILELPVLNNAAGGDTDGNYSSNIIWTNILLQKLKQSNIEVLILIPHPSTSEPAWYIKYIAQARLLACKYGFGIIDMYAKWIDNSLDGRADGTHLNDAGVEYYSEEILKVINCTGTTGASTYKGRYVQHGEGAAVGSVVFETPYLTVPKIRITPHAADQYVSAISETGFTVAGTGTFDWEASM